jgi:hypothetical protein
MPRFRPPCQTATPTTTSAGPISLAEARQVIGRALAPAHFFAAPGLELQARHEAGKEVAWELYQGRLLDPAQSRRGQVFEAWDLYSVTADGRSAEPLLSILLDAADRQVHVVRALECFTWEGYHAGDNVYLSRETRKWVRELVSSVSLDQLSDADELRDELICLLFSAVVGISRLPLTSVEAPLPAFSLGQLAYVYQAALENQGVGSLSMRTTRELLDRSLGEELAPQERVKLLETVLRGTPAQEIEAIAAFIQERELSSKDLLALLRAVFNEVALSPYTDFVEKVLRFVESLVRKGYFSVEEQVDFLSYLLRQNARHLTAYDLITFHHRGANYPDALLLDTVLRAYLALVEEWPELFIPVTTDDEVLTVRKCVRRRALRQAWLLRRACEGLPVPETPTSPGENARVLPPPHGRVAEEQILQPDQRPRQLFAGQPLVLTGKHLPLLMSHCLADLIRGEELRELGTALFLDRPFGALKPSGEPNQTLLLSYEAFSRSVAERRLNYLCHKLQLLSTEELAACRQNLHELPEPGVRLRLSGLRPRPGSVSLDDALKVADDFCLLRTTRQTDRQFFEQYDFSELIATFKLDFLPSAHRLLIVRAASVGNGADETLVVFDDRARRRLELQVDSSRGYQRRAGQEFPAAGLRVLRIWEASDDGQVLIEQQVGGGLIVPVRR